jgi:soluble lytic murein transglycosylase-like protein
MPALAAPPAPAGLPPNPDDCITRAAAYHAVSPYLLRAIAWQESRMRASAIGRNANGTLDLGALQINTIHLPRLRRYGIDARALMEPCTSAFVGAWLLREQFDRYGNTWQAVGAYHSQTPALNARYASSVMGILRTWGIQPRDDRAR